MWNDEVDGNGSVSSPSTLVLPEGYSPTANVGVMPPPSKQELAMLQEFLAQRKRLERKHIRMSDKEDPMTAIVMREKDRSRYFEEGRLCLSRKILERLGESAAVPGLLGTLTYDPKRMDRRRAWASFGRDTRRFLDAVRRYRRKEHLRKAEYVWGCSTAAWDVVSPCSCLLSEHRVSGATKGSRRVLEKGLG